MANTSESQATTAEVGHESGGHSNFPPFDPSTFPSQIVWLAITFGALYYYMSKRFLPKVGEVIETRRARIAKDLDEATAMQQQADAAAAAHEKALADARAKAQALAQATRDQLAAEADAKRKALEDELAAKLAAAEAQIAATRAAGDGECRGDRRGCDRRDRRAADRPQRRSQASSRTPSTPPRRTEKDVRDMEFGAEFFVLLGFLVFLCLLVYVGAHRMVLKGLDARGEQIADELRQAAKLREEAVALLASFEKKKAEAEASAAQIVADARVQAEQLAKDARGRA